MARPRLSAAARCQAQPAGPAAAPWEPCGERRGRAPKFPITILAPAPSPSRGQVPAGWLRRNHLVHRERGPAPVPPLGTCLPQLVAGNVAPAPPRGPCCPRGCPGTGPQEFLLPAASVCSRADLPACSYASIIPEFHRSLSLPGVYSPGVFIESNQACSARVNKPCSCGLLSPQRSCCSSQELSPPPLPAPWGPRPRARPGLSRLCHPAPVSPSVPRSRRHPARVALPVPLCAAGACSSCRQRVQRLRPCPAAAGTLRTIFHLSSAPEPSSGGIRACPGAGTDVREALRFLRLKVWV